MIDYKRDRTDEGPRALRIVAVVPSAAMSTRAMRFVSAAFFALVVISAHAACMPSTAAP